MHAVLQILKTTDSAGEPCAIVLDKVECIHGIKNDPDRCDFQMDSGVVHTVEMTHEEATRALCITERGKERVIQNSEV